MGEIIVIDQNIADELRGLGFQYTTRYTDRQNLFVFIQTKELMKELCSKFGQGSFVISNTVKY